MLTRLILTSAFVALAVALLSVGVVLSGRFRGQHIGESKAMRKRGICCAKRM